METISDTTLSCEVQLHLQLTLHIMINIHMSLKTNFINTFSITNIGK